MAKKDVAKGLLERMRTGIPGVDDVMGGGLPHERLYLVEGDPGTGKTTLSLQFLLEGVRSQESVLYLTLSESTKELRASAASHGWSLDAVNVREYVAPESSLSEETQITMFHPAEVELLETIRKMLADVDALNPKRVVVDSLSEIRLLAQDSFRYRRQLLALKEFFMKRRCTVLLLDDRTAGDRDRHVHSIVHGVVHLEQLATEYGAERRRLRVSKLRGTSYRGGWHDYIIRRGGLEVFPRLVASEHRTRLQRSPLSSGVPALDALLGGGVQSGTSTLILGPAGAGKTTVAMQFVVAAAKRKQRAAVFVFDETSDFLLERTAGLSLPLRKMVDSGHVSIQQIDPAELPPGRFTHVLRSVVEKDKANLIVIDSLNGYLAAMPEEQHLTGQLHELLTFLSQQNVATLMVYGQQGMIGTQLSAPMDASYLADSIILLRFFEAGGRVRKAISAVKKRSGRHEDTIRELRIGATGVEVGDALTNFRGILTGTPTFEGTSPAPSGAMVRDEPKRSKGARKGGRG